MNKLSVFSLIKSDLRRYKEPDNRMHWEEFSIPSIILYRSGVAIRNIRFFPLRILLTIFHLPFFMCYTLLSGIQIPRGCKIGPGLRIHHFGCIVLNPLTVLGKNCTLRHGVTIGNRQEIDDVPVLGDNVDIGAGAKILGRIHIGNNVTIGANAVVITDIPDNYIAVGIPAKAFPKKTTGT
jgi:serine O-acetyltransferase